jgi:hypothetical protein
VGVETSNDPYNFIQNIIQAITITAAPILDKKNHQPWSSIVVLNTSYTLYASKRSTGNIAINIFI